MWRDDAYVLDMLLAARKTLEFARGVEGDFATMERESRVAEGPNFEGLCFHAQ